MIHACTNSNLAHGKQPWESMWETVTFDFSDIKHGSKHHEEQLGNSAGKSYDFEQ